MTESVPTAGARRRARSRASPMALAVALLGCLWGCTLLAGLDGLADGTARPTDAAAPVDVAEDRAPEPFTFGTGRDGARTVTANTVASVGALVVNDVAVGARAVRVDDGSLFEAGRLIALFTALAAPASADRKNVADLSLTAAENVGRIAVVRIAAKNGADLALADAVPFPLTGGRTQVVQFAEYTQLTIAENVRLSAPPWDGARGGFLVLMASESVTIAGTVSASAAGFRGGLGILGLEKYGCPADLYDDEPGKGVGAKGEGIASTGITAQLAGGRGSVANGAGGGNCHNAGGGGGGNGGRGGTGGESWVNDGSRAVGGLGGARVVGGEPRRLVLGGGGGAGDAELTTGETAGSGGTGGGAVFILTPRLVGAGQIEANGADALVNILNGGGGGGAGGTVYAVTRDACEVRVAARGGIGASNGLTPGGGGGGGRLTFAGPRCPGDVAGGASGVRVGTPADAGTGNAAPGGDGLVE